MNKEKLTLSISNLERKIKFLIADHNTVKKELASIKSENFELKELVNKKEEQIIDFQNKYKISKIVQNIGDREEESSDLKNQINDYIREIDKCIVHLSQG